MKIFTPKTMKIKLQFRIHALSKNQAVKNASHINMGKVNKVIPKYK